MFVDDYMGEYFNENEYYEASYIISVLEDMLADNFANIKDMVINSKITVTKEEVSQFIETRYEEEQPNVKKRLQECPYYALKGNIAEWTKKDIDKSTRNFLDRQIARSYAFYPSVIAYFEKMTAILRSKAIMLLNIIEKISKKNTDDISGVLEDLDVNLDENGNIRKEDIIRLVTPTVENVRMLQMETSKGNELVTYLGIRRSCVNTNLYPSTSLQKKDPYVVREEGCVPLSNRQIKELRKKEKKYVKLIAEFFGGKR